jgi:hypothetical protein
MPGQIGNATAALSQILSVYMRVTDVALTEAIVLEAHLARDIIERGLGRTIRSLLHWQGRAILHAARAARDRDELRGVRAPAKQRICGLEECEWAERVDLGVHAL